MVVFLGCSNCGCLSNFRYRNVWGPKRYSILNGQFFSKNYRSIEIKLFHIGVPFRPLNCGRLSPSKKVLGIYWVNVFFYNIYNAKSICCQCHGTKILDSTRCLPPSTFFFSDSLWSIGQWWMSWRDSVAWCLKPFSETTFLWKSVCKAS